MRVAIPMIDIAFIAFMDPALTLKMSSSFVTRCSPLLLFFRLMIFVILFIVISSHTAA